MEIISRGILEKAYTCYCDCNEDDEYDEDVAPCGIRDDDCSCDDDMVINKGM